MKQILPLLTFLLVFSSLSAQTGDKAVEFYRNGVAFSDKGMFPEAYVSFKKAIAVNKKYDSAYVGIGLLYLKTNSPDSAIFSFKKAISLSPGMASAHIALGNAYRDYKPNYDSAIICYNTALKTDSLNKVIYYSLAWSYNAKKEYENAIPYGIKALELDNTYRPAYNELAHSYHYAKKYTEGIEQFKKNLAISVVDLAYLYSGLCYTQLKDKEGALKQYEDLKKINEKMAGNSRK